MYWPNLKSVSSPVPEIIAIGVLGEECEPQSWGRGGRRGSRMVPFERALITSYRPSMVTLPLSLRDSEILPLLCSSTPLFPTQLLVSSKFPHVPLTLGGWPLGNKERRCWANCPCNLFPSLPTYLITIHQRYRQTDSQTDRQTTCDRNTALCTTVHRAVKYHRYKTYTLIIAKLTGNRQLQDWIRRKCRPNNKYM